MALDVQSVTARHADIAAITVANQHIAFSARRCGPTDDGAARSADQTADDSTADPACCKTANGSAGCAADDSAARSAFARAGTSGERQSNRSESKKLFHDETHEPL
jgi:hypothetical protein